MNKLKLSLITLIIMAIGGTIGILTIKIKKDQPEIISEKHYGKKIDYSKFKQLTPKIKKPKQIIKKSINFNLNQISLKEKPKIKYNTKKPNYKNLKKENKRLLAELKKEKEKRKLNEELIQAMKDVD